MWLQSRIAKLFSDGQKPIPIELSLPPELWQAIIDYIVIPLCKPHRCADSSSFPALETRQRYSIRRIGGDEERAALLASYLSIRLVSRAWCIMAGPPPTMLYRHYEEALTEGEGSLVIGPPDTPFPLKLSPITSLVVNPSHIGLLFDQSTHLSRLESLTFASTNETSDFWHQIQTSFPSLLALTISQSPGNGGMLKIDRLEMLHIAWPQEPVTFHFPSLKHFSTSWPKQRTCIDNLLQFIQSHLYQLESLLVPTPSWITFEGPFLLGAGDEFWGKCPKLEVLGLHDSNLTRFNHPRDTRFTGPPVHHPLNHLRLYGEPMPFQPTPHVPQMVRDIEHLLDRSPYIKRISMDYQGPRRVYIEERCAKRNVVAKLLPQYGRLVEWPPPPPPKVQDRSKEFVIVIIGPILILAVISQPINTVLPSFYHHILRPYIFHNLVLILLAILFRKYERVRLMILLPIYLAAVVHLYLYR